MLAASRRYGFGHASRVSLRPIQGVKLKAAKSQCVLLFPVPVAVVQFEEYEEVNQRILDEINAVDWDAVHKELGINYDEENTSYEDTFIDLKRVPSCKVVLEQFVNGCGRFAEYLHWEIDPNGTSVNGYWAHITEPGGRTALHRHLSRHKPNHLSGVYYVQTPKNCGELCFFDDRLVRSYEPRVANRSTAPTSVFQFFKAIAGSMLIFPSWLTHRVGINKSDETRVSLSFNASLKLTKPGEGATAVTAASNAQ